MNLRENFFNLKETKKVASDGVLWKKVFLKI